MSNSLYSGEAVHRTELDHKFVRPEDLKPRPRDKIIAYADEDSIGEWIVGRRKRCLRRRGELNELARLLPQQVALEGKQSVGASRVRKVAREGV
jgi:hypothetical protein